MTNQLKTAYTFSGIPSIQIGELVLNNVLVNNAPINLVLKSLNRHGLIAGATGSGKTKTIQALCEQLSERGVPSLVMDIKGDISGLALPGNANDALLARNQAMNLTFSPLGFPVEFLSLNSLAPGVSIRSSVHEFGPVLFARLMDLNAVQSGVITVMFAFAEQEQWPLITLADVKELLTYLMTDAGKKAIEQQFGSMAKTTLTLILRKIIELEAGGAAAFFAEPSFEINDLIRHSANGQGIISIMRLQDSQDYPKLFTSCMLKLLADLYKKLPEIGDPEKPLLVLFIDEAHLIFKQASRALLDMIETIIKLIRSKGVGVIFCTQTSSDIPEAILSQLGLKIQHSLRAFTAKDRQSMKLVAQNFPPSSDYNIEQLLTSLSVGDALVCALSEKMEPLPVVQCRIRAPVSRMGVISDEELKQCVSRSTLVPYYKERKTLRRARPVNKNVPQDETKTPDRPSRHRSTEDASIISTLSKNTLFRQLMRIGFTRFINEMIKLFKK